MKKLVMTFAIVAFLIGGLSLNANAQDVKKTKKAKVENTQNKKDVNYDQMIKDFEFNVDKYIETYEKALKDNGAGEKAEDYRVYLKKAQDLEAKLLKAKEQLSRSQLDLFQRIQTRLAKALTKK